MDLLSHIFENKLSLVMLNEKQYETRLVELLRKSHKKQNKICYVCLSKPYQDVIKLLIDIGLDKNNFFFIDVLTSHYKKQKKVENCIFVESPDKLIALHVAINKAIMEKNCNILIFDTISSLLMYEQSHDIVKFTHQLTVETQQKEVSKVFIILKDNGLLGKYFNPLVKDVEMFADNTVRFDQM